MNGYKGFFQGKSRDIGMGLIKGGIGSGEKKSSRGTLTAKFFHMKIKFKKVHF